VEKEIRRPSLHKVINTEQKLSEFLCWRWGLKYGISWGMRVSESIWARKTAYKIAQQLQHGCDIVVVGYV
jgi:hypothetical protein